MIVVDEFKLVDHKTKTFAGIKQKLDLNKVLIVDDANKNLELSSRNVPQDRKSVV